MYLNGGNEHLEKYGRGVNVGTSDIMDIMNYFKTFINVENCRKWCNAVLICIMQNL